MIARLDVLLRNGMSVTVADLVTVFIRHRPGDAPTCGHCGHRYTKTAPLCPSRTLARDLLRTRRHEDSKATASIRNELDVRDTRALPEAAPARAKAASANDGLFAVAPEWRTARRGRR